MAIKLEVFKFNNPNFDNVAKFADLISSLPSQSRAIQDFYDEHLDEWKLDLFRYKYFAKLNRFNEIIDNQIKSYKILYAKELENLYFGCSKIIMQDYYLKKLRYNTGKNVCPYCGRIGPTTLDHYLPRDSFPEFSVLIYNLVPSCSVCQSKKNDLYSSSNKRFIHPYFDEFIEDIELNVIFNYDDTYVDFNIEVHYTRSDINKQEIINYHYNKILESHLYQNTFMPHWTGLLKKVKRGDFKNILELYKKIKECFRDELDKHNAKNSWDTIFYSSLLKDKRAILFLSKYIKK